MQSLTAHKHSSGRTTILIHVSVCTEIHPKFQVRCHDANAQAQECLIPPSSSSLNHPNRPPAMAPMTWRGFTKEGRGWGEGIPSRDERRRWPLESWTLRTRPSSTPQASGSLLPNFTIDYTAMTSYLKSLNLSFSIYKVDLMEPRSRSWEN